jgi:hypothetical protein
VKFFEFRRGIGLRGDMHSCDNDRGAQQHLFKLRRLKKFGLSPKTLTNFYRCTVESILSGCITTWYTRGKLPALQDSYST